ncbi:glycoside hydrolase family 25 protein [Endozoicomonas atrinae]|uniref:glycoside hydrolase family 25 protein n=1 Tax=Endozoicomonas atrinae TaxID=1333660 RepID=UPI003AFFF52D
MFYIRQISKRTWLLLIDVFIFNAVVLLLYFSFVHTSKSKVEKKETRAVVQRKVTISPDINLEGVDVSHYQGQIDWSIIADKIHFAFVKATESNHYVDPKFHLYIEGLENTDIKFGAYHFFSPHADPLAQAEYFIDNTKGYKFSLPPVIDIEVAPNHDLAGFQNGIQIWLDKVGKSTGCTPIIYSNKSFWNQYLKQRFSDYPVWISDYTTHQDYIANIPWRFWQYSDHGRIDGISGFVDKSIYRGSIKALATLGGCQV